MKDSTRRALRTGVQVIYSLLTSGVIVGLLKVIDVGVTVEQYTAVSLALTPVVAWLLNVLEGDWIVPGLPAKQ